MRLFKLELPNFLAYEMMSIFSYAICLNQVFKLVHIVFFPLNHNCNFVSVTQKCLRSMTQTLLFNECNLQNPPQSSVNNIKICKFYRKKRKCVQEFFRGLSRRHDNNNPTVTSHLEKRQSSTSFYLGTTFHKNKTVCCGSQPSAMSHRALTPRIHWMECTIVKRKSCSGGKASCDLAWRRHRHMDEQEV